MNQYKDPHYDWDKWFSNPRFKLERGKHFTAQNHGMAIMVRQAARKRGLKVSVHIKENILTVEVKGSDDKEDSNKVE
jgi:hypothetical protein